ncbi:MAG: hypothetical protein MI810_00215 [Flavobacteriales bacterium]|nr:hypothetical protein [Flavobacteriales bacterium]
MKHLLLVGFLMLVLTSYSQQNALTVKMGLNRIGLFVAPSYQRVIKKHEFTAGLKFYTQDQVFERRYPGLLLGYDFQLFSFKERLFGKVGWSSSIFFENKSSGNLLLFDHMAHLGIAVAIIPKLHFALEPGIGLTNNVVYGELENPTDYHYLNYGLAVRLTYYFGSSD